MQLDNGQSYGLPLPPLVDYLASCETAVAEVTLILGKRQP